MKIFIKNLKLMGKARYFEKLFQGGTSRVPPNFPGRGTPPLKPHPCGFCGVT